MHVTNSQSEDMLQLSYYHGGTSISCDSKTEHHEIFLFGNHISHSLAPLLHTALFQSMRVPWTYTLSETDSPSLFLPKLKASNVAGCAITMPYKITLMEQVDEVTEEGEVKGSFLQNFLRILEESSGRPGLVIGGGGACRSAVYALRRFMKSSKIYMVNRLKSEADSIIMAFEEAGFDGELIFVESVGQARLLAAPAVIVDTVPDFPPGELGEILAREIVEGFLGKEKKGYVLEMAYHPNPRTAFYQLAVHAGWKTLPGTEAMVYQGVAQQVLWTETPIALFELDEAKKAIAGGLQSLAVL
ncbi:related to quinate 5-dehydrogenase [Phialocephala subalpina]|uniref:Related to quinate 5-dehydrogenase n=1 Tax=Phialocephala subalpina TaxID=576137 RepID=A0A1L7WQQ6_9HELO|nr:related to quinate 5-dehydrogenase [Phialocephala subalpina]